MRPKFVALNDGPREFATVRCDARLLKFCDSAFGVGRVTAMLVTYALEDRSQWFVLGFAVSCALGSIYGFWQGAWPFGLVEAIWAGVALRRWSIRRR